MLQPSVREHKAQIAGPPLSKGRASHGAPSRPFWTRLPGRTTPQSVSLQVLVEVPAIKGESGHPAILVDGAAFTG